MTKRILAKLRKSHEEFIASCKAKNKNRIAKWTCQECGHENETLKPGRGSVNSRGCWDGSTICVGCGDTVFKQVFPSGKVIITQFKTLANEKGNTRG